MLGKRERIATETLCLFRENREGDPGRCAPLGAPSDGGLTAGERERVNVLRSCRLERLLCLEWLERDWPLPCRTMNVPLPLVSFLFCVPILR